MQEINIYDAMRLMRKLSAENFPFKIEFASCDRTRGISKGKVVVEKAKSYRVSYISPFFINS